METVRGIIKNRELLLEQGDLASYEGQPVVVIFMETTTETIEPRTVPRHKKVELGPEFTPENRAERMQAFLNSKIEIDEDAVRELRERSMI